MAVSVVQWMQQPPVTLVSRSTTPARVLGTLFPSQILTNATGRQRRTQGLLPYRLDDLPGILGFWFWPVLHPAIVAVWRVNQRLEDLSPPLSLMFCLSCK